VSFLGCHGYGSTPFARNAGEIGGSHSPLGDLQARLQGVERTNPRASEYPSYNRKYTSSYAIVKSPKREPFVCPFTADLTVDFKSKM
jgi:hypothetical protein